MKIIQVLLSTKEWHFGLKKAWRKTQILLKYASLTWQFTAWRADQMLTLESFALQLLLLPAMCCQQILLCHLNTFPKPSTCYIFYLMLRICNYNESSWMDYLQSEFFHGSSNGLILNICSHTRSNWFITAVVSFMSLQTFLSQWEQLNGLSLVWVLSCLFKWLDIEHLKSH